ncbi:MAG: hypothetical protein GY866_31925, partial [Proteobacteria bacterium]|nr:hypothetical protein [Pseudomonadota bacterium]
MHYTIRKFDEYMEYRRYSPKTRSSNTKAVEDITAFFAKDPEEISQMNLLFQTVNRTLQTFAADPKHKL